MHALITYLVPIFDSSSNLIVSCPPGKSGEIAAFFQKRGWGDSTEIIPEDQLSTAFTLPDKAHKEGEQASTAPETKDLPAQVAGVSMFEPGAFAAQFKCACPKCDR